MTMMEKQNDEWYTEEDVDSKLSWNKLEEEYANVGYREGITAGKERALQEGFDDSFASIGAPLGREVGILRGTVHVLLARWENQANDDTTSTQSVPYNELRALSRRLDAIRLKDLAPKDVQAELHALEHMDVEKEGQDDVLAQSFSTLGTADRPDARKELNEIKIQLQSIFCNMVWRCFMNLVKLAMDPPSIPHRGQEELSASTSAVPFLSPASSKERLCLEKEDYA